jgi:hypothetical protein
MYLAMIKRLKIGLNLQRLLQLLAIIVANLEVFLIISVICNDFFDNVLLLIATFNC